MPEPTRPDVRMQPTRAGQHGLFAARAFGAGETILTAEGVVRAGPTRTSLQIGPARHLDVPPDAAPETHLWRYLEHACRPNAAFRGRRLEALQPIADGEELTFDYETTEWELAEPFACACGRAGCTGRKVRGFLHLTPEERRRRRPQLRDDLRRLADGAGAAPTRAP